MAYLKNRVGEKFITNEGYEVEVVDYKNHRKVLVQFENEYSVITRIDVLKVGKLKNPYHPNTQGIGYMGVGKYKACFKSQNNKNFSLWNSIISRCYNEKSQKRQPHYENTTVCEEWHNFQNFAKWFEENYNSETMQEWHLDKDILAKGNKVYSPETCCFVPRTINLLFTKKDSCRGKYPIGVISSNSKYRANISKNSKITNIGLFNTPKEAFQAYKIEKEKHIKEVADEWKDLISQKTYGAMHNYKVEITD